MTESTLPRKLRRLRLGHMARNIEAQNERSLQQKHSHLEFLTELVDAELSERDNNRLNKRIKAARFPALKSLEEFDFDFQPKLDAKLIKSLASCDFVGKKQNVILVGQPGTGKTHLAIALGLKAIEHEYRVRFTTIQDLAADLRASLADDSTEKLIRQLLEPDLLILDELGFTNLDAQVADAFYRIVASRYERASLIVTSNKSFESWGEILPDSTIASAILDRLVQHAYLVPIVGQSYRMKNLKRQKGGDDQTQTDS